MNMNPIQIRSAYNESIFDEHLVKKSLARQQKLKVSRSECSINQLLPKLMNLKQQESSNRKSREKKLNDFRTHFNLSQDLFDLSENPSDDPFNSQILIGKKALELFDLCEFTSKDKFKLLYRGSQDGFSAKDFHSKCDGHANTLTIIKAKNSGFIFGAFTSAKWDCSGNYKLDPNAFIFSLKNKEKKPCKLNTTNAAYSMACSPTCGPIFGYGIDIQINFNSNENISYSNLGSVYRHPKYAFGSNEAKSFLAGSHEFKLSEIEVYIKITGEFEE